MKKIIIICIAALLLLLLFVSPVLAESVKKNIDVSYNNIKLVVDGRVVTPKDVNGNIVEPFIYNGTTYLPVRAVSEALGKRVEWDPATYTVYVGENHNLQSQEQEQTQPQTQSGETDETDETEESTTPAKTTADNTIVYVSDASKTIHSIHTCGNMKNYKEMTLTEARKITSTYCKRCAEHLKDIE